MEQIKIQEMERNENILKLIRYVRNNMPELEYHNYDHSENVV